MTKEQIVGFAFNPNPQLLLGVPGRVASSTAFE
jgi:hypothetical protein